MHACSSHQLVQLNGYVGDILMVELLRLQENGNAISGVRGQGTFVAFDLPTPAIRDTLIQKMRNLGVQMNGCGTRTIRLRPMLVFGPRHAAQFVEILEKALCAL
jgi:4-aminobutyrate aminotransferase / (S)-3-amino-2-methylpropionate transaminase